MKCSKIVDLLGPYMDGECSPEECRRVEEHLRQCPACRSQLEELRRIEAVSRQTVPADPGDEYWNTFLPRLRRRIDRPQRRPATTGRGRRIRQWFQPPVPWIRLAGAVATAALVVVIGRAFIDQKGDLVPMPPPAGEITEKSGMESDVKEEAPAPAERRGVLDEKVSAGKGAKTGAIGEISTTGADKPGPADALTGAADIPTERADTQTGAVDEAAPEKAAAEAVPQTGEPAHLKKDREVAPVTGLPAEPPDPSSMILDVVSGEGTRLMTDAATDAAITEERADEGLPAPAITEEADRQEKEPAIRTMARSTADRNRREGIRYWQAVIDTSSDRDAVAHAHLSLAGIWYDLAMAGPDPEDLSAALRAHRDALEFAAGDSVRQFLLERISRLEERQQKK
jgi:hypothetical protein